MKTVLAVDDSATMREMVAFVLESAGYRVIEAEDGVKGLERARATAVDLVITDQNMPNMDGITLVRSLRELREYKTIPILLLTTESSDSMKSQGRAAGRHGLARQALRPHDAARSRPEGPALAGRPIPWQSTSTVSSAPSSTRPRSTWSPSRSRRWRSARTAATRKS